MAGLHFDITGDNKNFLRKLQEVSNGVKSTTREVESEGDKMTAIFDKIGKAMGTAIAGVTIKELVSKIAQVRSEFQKLEVAFGTMLGDSSKANELMMQLTKTAAITPFGLQDVAGGAKQLLAYGLAADKVNETLVRLGDISAGLSIPLSDLVYLYGTTMTQGRLFTMDLRQFMGRGIPLAEELAKQFGVTKDEVAGLVTAGRVGFDQVQKAIESMTDAGGKFGGLMEAQSKTIGGQISNLEDAIDVMFNELGKSSEGVINFAIGTASSLVENYETVGRLLTGLVASYGVYKAALILTSAIESARIVSLRATAMGVQANTTAVIGNTIATKANTIAQAAFNAVAKMNPYALIASVAVAAGTAVWAYAKNINEAKIAEESYANHKNDLIEKEKKHREEIEALISVAEDDAISTDLRKNALYQLEKKYPDIFAKYQTEYDMLSNIKRIKEEIAGIDANKSESQIMEARIKELEEKEKSAYYETRGSSAGAYKVKIGGLTQEESLELNMLKGKLNAQKRKEMQDAYFTNLTGISNTELEEEIQHRKDLLAKMELLKKEYGEITYGRTTNMGVFSKSELEAQLNSLEREQNRRAEKGKTPAQYLEELKKAWLEADKAYKDFIKNNSDKLSEEEFKKKSNELKAARDADKKAYEEKGGSVTSDNKALSESVKIAKAQAEYAQVIDIQNKKRQKQIRDNAIEQRQLEIDLMSESSAKRIAQISLDYQKENATIQDWEEELRRTKIEEAKKTFEADPRNKDKVFNSSTVDTSLTEDESSLKAQKEVNAFLKLRNDLFNANNAISDSEKAANAEYVRQYGTYLERKELLLREHNEKLAKIREDGGGENAIKLENANYEASLQELEVIFGKTTNKINLLFADTRGKSAKELRKIAEEARKALNWVLNNEFDSNNNYGITQEQYDKLRNNPSAQKDENDSIDEIESKANSLDDAFGLLKEGIDKTFDSDNLEDFKKGLDLISQGVGAITGALSVVQNALSSLGAEGAAEVIGEVSNVLNTTMQGAQAGSAFGSVGAAIGGAIGLVGSLGGALTKLHDKKHEKTIIKLQEQIDALAETYDDLSDNVEKAYSHDAQGLIEDQNKLLEQKKVLIRQQIKEEEEKKKTDKERIKEWENELKEIDKRLEENKEKAIDAIFGEDLQTAIENFASAYADAVASGDGSWKSAKDYAKNMMKQMVVESIKSATQSSNAIGLIRSKLLDFYKDGVLSATEQAWVYNATEKAMKEIESQFGWADSLLKDDSAMQEASSKGLASLTQEQGDELNGRATALQLAGESIRESMLAVVGRVDGIYSVTTDSNEQLKEIRNLVFLSTGYLEDIAKNSKPISEMNVKLDKIVENTKGLI